MLGLDNPLHIAIVLIVVLLVFGAKRLPEMGKSLGEGLRGFKASVSGEGDDDHVPTPALTPVTADQPVAPTADQPVAPSADRTPAAPVA